MSLHFSSAFLSFIDLNNLKRLLLALHPREVNNYSFFLVSVSGVFFMCLSYLFPEVSNCAPQSTKIYFMHTARNNSQIPVSPGGDTIIQCKIARVRTIKRDVRSVWRVLRSHVIFRLTIARMNNNSRSNGSADSPGDVRHIVINCALSRFY